MGPYGDTGAATPSPMFPSPFLCYPLSYVPTPSYVPIPTSMLSPPLLYYSLSYVINHNTLLTITHSTYYGHPQQTDNWADKPKWTNAKPLITKVRTNTFFATHPFKDTLSKPLFQRYSFQHTLSLYKTHKPSPYPHSTLTLILPLPTHTHPPISNVLFTGHQS